jgi:subtilase family serine protease
LRLAKKLAVVAGICGLAATTATTGTAVSAVAGGPGQSSAVAGGPGQSSAVAGGPGQLSTVAGGPGQSSAVAGGTGNTGTASASALADVIVRPAIRHIGTTRSAPTTTAQCEKLYSIACYEPAQLQQAYDLPWLYSHGITGRGRTIVIVDSFGSPTIRHDLAVFDSTFHLPAPPSLQIIAPAGKIPPYNPKNSDMVGWAGETTLDVEYAHTVAPGANILLVETPVSETEGVHGFPQIVSAEEYVIKHYHADVISQSFSATEETFPSPARASVNALRGANLAAQRSHVTMLTASGDSGAADVGLNGSTYYLFPVTSWSDSDPLVTGVGGTQLHLNAAGRRTAPDNVWNDTYSKAANEFVFGDAGPNPDAGGGGKSVLFNRPGYQNGVKNVVGNSRGVPDISMSAACNGSVDTYSSFTGAPAGWSQTCGTSEATPLFAGVVALAAQLAGHPLGLINPALYEMSLHGLPGIVPVTKGNNTVSFRQGGHEYTVHGFNAKAGYSLAAGVGTVDGRNFVPELAALVG